MEADRNFVDESTLRFIFDKCVNVVKFDETAFYRNRFNGFPGAKGVDIIAESDESIQLIEIKDCLGYETENIWRTSVDNSKLKSAPSGLPADSSFDIEVVQKVMATIACLYGAWSKSERMQQSVVLSDFWKAFTNDKITKDKKKLRIVLFLEGDFYANGPKSRNKKMIMKRLQDWLFQGRQKNEKQINDHQRHSASGYGGWRFVLDKNHFNGWTVLYSTWVLCYNVDNEEDSYG